MSKINLYFCFDIWGFAPYPSSFIGIKEPKEPHLITPHLGIAKIWMLSCILYIFQTYKAEVDQNGYIRRNNILVG